MPSPVLADLRRRYGESQRHYHTWSHVEAMLAWFDVRTAELHDVDGVFLAILFHDAVYDPDRKDNEAASARLLAEASLPLWSAGSIEAAGRMILATARHQPSTDLSGFEAADTAEFLDMDLSILGASERVFQAYDAAIRREYKKVPLLIYWWARRSILKTFLARPELFFSRWGQATFETAARKNLARKVGMF